MFTTMPEEGLEPGHADDDFRVSVPTIARKHGRFVPLGPDIVVGRPSPGTGADPEVASPAQLGTPSGTTRSSAARAKEVQRHRTCTLSGGCGAHGLACHRRHTEVFRELAARRVRCDLRLSTNPQVQCRHRSGLCLVTVARTWVPSGNPLSSRCEKSDLSLRGRPLVRPALPTVSSDAAPLGRETAARSPRERPGDTAAAPERPQRATRAVALHSVTAEAVG